MLPMPLPLGPIPTITIGGRIFAVVAALERMLAKAGENVRQVQFLCHNSTSSRMATTSDQDHAQDVARIRKFIEDGVDA